MEQVKALFIQSSNSGVAYWRMANFVNAAHRVKAGHFFLPWYDKSLNEVHPWQIDILDPIYKKRILDELWDHAKKADVVIFQILHTPAALNLFMSMKQALPNIPVMTECDDQILSTPSYNPADSCYRPGGALRGIAIDQMRHSDAMIVSTPYLKEVYSEYCDNIHVIPNCLDFRRWDNLKHPKKKDFIRIGWAGGY